MRRRVDAVGTFFLIGKTLESMRFSGCQANRHLSEYDSAIVECDDKKKIGVAISSLKIQPIRGRRYLPQGDTEGWFIWGGEYSDHVDFYSPVHVGHVIDIVPIIVPYLALEPGFSFIIDFQGYEDVWYSEQQSKKFCE